MPRKEKVRIVIQNVFGEELAVLVNQLSHAQGNHAVTFDATNYPAGIYYCTVEIGDSFNKTVRMISIK